MFGRANIERNGSIIWQKQKVMEYFSFNAFGTPHKNLIYSRHYHYCISSLYSRSKPSNVQSMRRYVRI